jgi:muconolactone delta-isomerase
VHEVAKALEVRERERERERERSQGICERGKIFKVWKDTY